MEKLKTAEIVDAVLILEKLMASESLSILKICGEKFFWNHKKLKFNARHAKKKKNYRKMFLRKLFSVEALFWNTVLLARSRQVVLERLDTKCSILGKCERLPMVNA